MASKSANIEFKIRKYYSDNVGHDIKHIYPLTLGYEYGNEPFDTSKILKYILAINEALFPKQKIKVERHQKIDDSSYTNNGINTVHWVSEEEINKIKKQIHS